jgi:uncharacterized membrane protein
MELSYHIERSDERITIKKQGRGSEITTFLMRLYCLACAILGGTWCFGLANLMFQHPDIFTVEPWYQLALGILLVGGSLYGYFLANHRVVVAVLVPAAVYEIAEMIYTPYIRLNRAFGAWDFFASVQAIFGLLLVSGVAFVILHLVFVSVKRVKQRRVMADQSVSAENRAESIPTLRYAWKKHKRVHLVFMFVLAGSGFLTAAFVGNWFVPSDASVTLHPGDYDVRFQFYGDADYNFYNSSERASFNALGVRIIDGVAAFISYSDYTSDPYLWWMNLTDYKQTADYQNKRTAIVNRFTPWKLNAPNVTFLYWLGGVPSGLPTDYSVTTGYWGVGALLLNAWLTAEVIVEENLTNVVGFHTDQEGISENEAPVAPLTGSEFMAERDYERNMQARVNYIAFFNRLRFYEHNNATWSAFVDSMNQTQGVDHLLFTTTYGDLLVNDGLDDDWDMDVFTMNNVNTLPYDEFLPMLYHQSRFPPDNAHYALYFQMMKLKATLAKAGYPERIGALLGCMGTENSLFLPNYTGTQFVDGVQQLANGFDVIARQVMIAKAFNCTWVSFFPQTARYVDQDIIGIWDTYGHGFFEELNATVNGPGSASPFRIKFYPDVAGMNVDLARDVFLSDAWAWFYLAALIAALCLVCFHQGYKALLIALKKR